MAPFYHWIPENQESAQIPGADSWFLDVLIPGFWNPMVKWCNVIFL
jgi:hypothetical protein